VPRATSEHGSTKSLAEALPGEVGRTRTGTRFANPACEGKKIMTRSTKLGLAFAFATGWLSTPAHADIPPPDTCEKAGAACLNAGQTFDQPGTCFERTCTKGPPGEQVSYDCLRCEAEGEGGSGGAGGEPGTGGTAGEPGGAATGGKANAGAPSAPPKSDDDSDDGCSVRGVGPERGFAGLMLLVGLALLGRGRRR